MRLLPQSSPVDIQPLTLNTIIVFRIDRLGDLVLSMPVFSELKRCFPQAKLIACVNEQYLDLVKTHSDIDSIHPFPTGGSFRRKLASLNSLRQYSADLAIDLEASYRFFPVFCVLLSRVKYRAGFAIFGKDRFYHIQARLKSDKMHLTAVNQELIEAVTGKSFVSSLFCEDSAAIVEKREYREWIEKKKFPDPETYFIIHSGGTHSTQKWLPARFAAVADRLIQTTRLKCVLLAGPGEHLEAQEISKAMAHPCTILSDLSLKEMMALIIRCRLFSGNNTGTAHLAAYFQKPNISTMGPTKYWLFHPLGDHSAFLRKRLSCSPCTLTHCWHHSCMKLIETDAFIRLAETQLALSKDLKEEVTVSQKPLL
jgi:ADP-heptose:LPS heptosyltransferase